MARLPGRLVNALRQLVSDACSTEKMKCGITSFKGQGAAYSYAINPHGLVRGQQCDLVLQAGVDTSWHAGKFTA